jgi:hypothetical protein
MPNKKIAAWGAGTAALAAIVISIVVPAFRRATHPPSEVAASQPERMVGVAAGSIEELRARNHVTLIPASKSEHTLAEAPEGSYGFVFAPYIAHSSVNALRLYTHNDPAYFEVHKLPGGQAEFIGYVESATQERLQKGLGKGEKLTLYSSSWQKAPNPTAISFGSVKCARSRDMSVRHKGGTIVLFALDCKAI